MSRDVLLYGLSQSEDYASLLHWMQTTPGLHEFPAPDFHRVQLEHWVWSHRHTLGPAVLDVGVYNPRRYFGDGYVTFGEVDTSTGEDTKGDLLAMPFPDASFDGVILTEVLEHCIDPPAALREVFRILKSGGRLLVTSPFLWPDHRTEDYQDYWRFTEQGWALLLRAFTDVQIIPCALTPEGQCAYDFMRRFEAMGFNSHTKITTGYLCEAVKG